MADRLPALFAQSELRPGETVLIQGATGGMATALIQLGRAAGFEVWATSRTEDGQAQARALGAQQAFASNEPLPRKSWRSWTMSVLTPGRTVFRRSPTVARW